MASPHPVSRSRVVGDLACQRHSYLQTIDTEVISCVELPPRSAGQNTPETETKVPIRLSEDECSSTSLKWLIEFADSVLFPEGTAPHPSVTSLFLTNKILGGGQPTDYGSIFPLTGSSCEPIPITSVQRQGLRCVYQSPQPLAPGTPVRQEVDFRRRWDHMQQHTGQHLLSAVMDIYDNLETLG